MSEQPPELPFADITVEPNAWGQASNEQIINTEGIATCVGLAIFDPTTRTGYLAHGQGNHLETLREMMETVVANSSDISKARAWLVGALEEEYPEVGGISTTELRSEAIALLNSIGIPEDSVSVSWIDDPEEIIDISLNCETGECLVIVSSEPDIPEDQDYYDQ